jgi:hypothetical protein
MKYNRIERADGDHLNARELLYTKFHNSYAWNIKGNKKWTKRVNLGKWS